MFGKDSIRSQLTINNHKVRTYENYVIIPQSYIIPSFQVRQAFPLATPKKTAKAVLVKKTKEKIPYVGILQLFVVLRIVNILVVRRVVCKV